MAQTLRENSCQAYAVGKMNVYPQRDRIRFDDVILAEEVRYHFGINDDYQLWLNENGFAGLEFGKGMSSNEYMTRPWHLPEEAHQTNWTTREMVKIIREKIRLVQRFFLTIIPIPSSSSCSAFIRFRDV